ncbi:hypothetical protein U1872_18505 [Sphingomonas sp. RB3P16]
MTSIIAFRLRKETITLTSQRFVLLFFLEMAVNGVGEMTLAASGMAA